jgi:hypothetical protein
MCRMKCLLILDFTNFHAVVRSYVCVLSEDRTVDGTQILARESLSCCPHVITRNSEPISLQFLALVFYQHFSTQYCLGEIRQMKCLTM